MSISCLYIIFFNQKIIYCSISIQQIKINATQTKKAGSLRFKDASFMFYHFNNILLILKQKSLNLLNIVFHDHSQLYFYHHIINQLKQFQIIYIRKEYTMIPKQLYSYNNLNPNIPIFIQIKNLIASITVKKNLKSTKNDILYLINLHGYEAEKYMFICLFQTIDNKQFKEKGQSSGKITFLTQQLIDFSTRQSFLSYFPQVLMAITKNVAEYMQTLLKFLKLSILTQLILCLAMYLSENAQISKEGLILLKIKLKEYYESGKPIANPPPPPRLIEQLLFQIGKNPELLEELEAQYKYLLQTNPIDKIEQTRCHHYLKKNSKVYNYEPFTIIEKKPADLIKKVDILRDLGPYCTFNIQSLKTILQQFGNFTEEDVFECLMLMAEQNSYLEDSLDRFMTDLLVAQKKCSKSQEWKKFYSQHDLAERKMQANWNVQQFITFAVQNVNNLKWVNVMNHFDRQKLTFNSHEVFVNMFKYLQKAKKQGPKFKTPENIFFKRWNHPKSQATFLINVFKCQQPQLFGFNEISNKRTSKSINQNLKSNQNINTMQYQLWGYLDLVQLLVELSQYNYMGIRQTFDFALTRCPDILAYTLSQIKPLSGQAILDELFSQIFPIYLSNHTNYIKLLETLWENNDELVISNICELYKNQNKKENSCLNLSRVLDITQNIRQSLIPLANWNDYTFSVALGILAGKRQFLHFQQWIKQRLKNVGTPFLNAILSYVDQNLLAPVRQIITTYGTNYPSLSQSFDLILQKAQLSRQLLAFIFQSALQIPGNKFSLRTVQKLKKFYKEVCQYFPELSQTQMPDEIELLAQKHFHRIYKEQITLEETIQMMIKLKNSNKQEQKQLYASMITFLFTELRFHSNYPEKELMITANFFAGIINNNLIEKKLFNVFLQVLRDDLKLTNKKFDFAIHVVQKIKSKLKEQAEFCESLIDSQPILTKNPELVNELIKAVVPPITLSPEKSLQLQNALNIKLAPPPPPQIIVEEKPIKVEADLDILESQDRSLQISIGDKQKRITTLFNTLTSESLNDKLKQLEKILDTKESIKWFSYYLVFRRISYCSQNNALEVFLNLFNKFKRAEKYIMKVTYKILQKWFSLTGKTVNDKKLKNIKNIGYWLGKLTLARNQPILINKLNIKEILINSFRKKVRLSPNLEVILRILESTKQSKVIYCVKNPWYYPILCILKQIIQWVEVGQSNEIQRFFKAVNIQEQNIQGTQYLPFDQQNKPSSLTIAQLPNFVQINEQELGIYLEKGIDIRKIIAESVDSAIQQIVPPVIARSVTIALVTTKQLALKDFANQPDEKKLLKGTNLIAQNLAGSLALVTCRQPLRMSLSNFMKKKLEQYSNLNEQDKESIISVAARDNLDLGCALIKKAVIEKALEDISKDAIINEHLQKRREAMQQGQTYYNESYLSDIADYVPQVLRPKFGGLTNEQFKIYQDFNKQKKGYLDPKDSSKQKIDKIINSIKENEPISQIKELINKTQINQTQLAQKIHLLFAESKQTNTSYYINILKLLKQSIQPEDVYKHFRQHINSSRKDYQYIISELSKEGYFPPSSVDEIKKTKIQTNYKDDEEQKRSIKNLEDWINVQDSGIGEYFTNIQQYFNKGGEDKIKKFFYFNLNYAVQKVLQTENASFSDTLDFLYIDEYSKLITVSLKLIVLTNRSVYLDHVFEAIFKVLSKYHDNPDKPFNQRPFFKLILNLIYDMIRKQYNFQNNVILTVYSVLTKLFHKLQPLNYPGFCFAWLELISNKYFMPTILDKHQYWDSYHQLIVDLLRFSREKLTEEALREEACRNYYKGILRVVIMLLHDFPDFFSEFSISLAPQIADIFIQLRNIILSAFPKQLKFPQPQNFKQINELDLIENNKKLPIYYNLKFDKTIQITGVIRSEAKFNALKIKIEKQGYNLDLFALQVPWIIYENSYPNQKILQLEDQHTKLIISLLIKLNDPTKIGLIRAILNLIRFPNIITIFFIRLTAKILYEDIEQHLKILLLRSIMQRMKMQKPHPWGLIFITNHMKLNKKKLSGLNMKEIQQL